MASATKNVLGKSSGKDDEASRIARLIDKEQVNKQYASAQVEGGDKLTVDGPGSGRKANGVIKG